MTNIPIKYVNTKILVNIIAIKWCNCSKLVNRVSRLYSQELKIEHPVSN